MNAIKLRFKLFGKKTQFERDIVKITCHSDLSLPPEKLLTRSFFLKRTVLIFAPAILTSFKESDSNRDSKQNIKLFLDHLHTIKRWEDAAKFLIIVHQAIHDEISGFVHEFAAVDMENIMDLPNDKAEFKVYVRCGLMKYYYRYLKKLANAYYSLRKCRRYRPSDYATLLQQNDSQLVFQYSQLKDLVTFVAKVEDFYVSSSQLSEIPILQLIGEMMLRDCVDMYNLLATFVTKSIGSIFQLPEELALSLDTVYSDVIRLKKLVSSFYEIKGFFRGLVAFNEPDYYYLDKDFNRKEELYINAIRKQRRNLNFSHSQSMMTLPDKPSNFFSIDDDEENEYHLRDSGKSDHVKIDLGSRSKSMVMEKKYNLENETLLTSEDKDYSEDATEIGQKSRKKLDSAISLSSMLSSKQLNGSPAKLISFSKVQAIDLEQQ